MSVEKPMNSAVIRQKCSVKDCKILDRKVSLCRLSCSCQIYDTHRLHAAY